VFVVEPTVYDIVSTYNKTGEVVINKPPVPRTGVDETHAPPQEGFTTLAGIKIPLPDRVKNDDEQSTPWE